MNYVENPARILATYIDASGVADFPEDDVSPPSGWTVTHDQMPNEGERASDRPWIMVKDTMAVQQGRQMRSGERTEYYELQLIGRGTAEGDIESKSKFKGVCDLLDSVNQTLVTTDSDNFRLNHVERRSGFAFLKQEDKYKMRLYVMTVRLRVTKE